MRLAWWGPITRSISGTPEQALTLLARHAPGNDNLQVAPPLCALALSLPPHRRVNLLLRLVANGACVVDDHVGVVRLGGAGVPHRLKDARHPLGVGHVHLAAEGLDVVA